MRLKHYLEQGDVEGGVVEAVQGEPGGRSTSGSRRASWTGTLSSGRTRYASRPRGPQRLDPYKGIIEARLGEFPKLSAQRLFDEVRAAGYPGGYSRVRDYVCQVRPREPRDEVRFLAALGEGARTACTTSEPTAED